MSLSFNGVLIPENVANALSFNGVDITDVFFNGVQVWNQALFNATWSGDSTYTSVIPMGIDTSGSSHRWIAGTVTTSGTGAWVVVNADGTFPTAYSTTTHTSYSTTYTNSIYTTGSLLKYHGTPGSTSIPYMTFTVGSGFTGSSLTADPFGFESSGGLMRFRQSSTFTGAWISLT